jgi:protein-S-isoprenylcysteine O-methyltransferase Ste14
MNVLGIGPQLLAAGGIPLAVILRLQSARKIAVRMPPPFRQVFKVVGIAMCTVGAFFWITGGLKVEKAFREHRLETSGVFRLSRNPLYAAFIVFIIPGASLVSNNLLVLAASPAMFAVFKLRIGKEEEYLLREFGDDFLEYEREVPQLVPFVRFSRRGT